MTNDDRDQDEFNEWREWKRRQAQTGKAKAMKKSHKITVLIGLAMMLVGGIGWASIDPTGPMNALERYDASSWQDCWVLVGVIGFVTVAVIVIGHWLRESDA